MNQFLLHICIGLLISVNATNAFATENITNTQIPVYNLKDFPNLVSPIRTAVIWMMQRNESYSKKHPTLRPQNNINIHTFTDKNRQIVKIFCSVRPYIDVHETSQIGRLKGFIFIEGMICWLWWDYPELNKIMPVDYANLMDYTASFPALDGIFYTWYYEYKNGQLVLLEDNPLFGPLEK